MGTLELLVPQEREGAFTSEPFHRCQRSEKVLVSMLMQGERPEGDLRLLESGVGAGCRQGVVERWVQTPPAVAGWVEEGIEETPACSTLPEAHWRRIGPAIGLERFHQELKRRTRVVRIFPSREACPRLVAASCVEQSEEWLSGRRRYLGVSLLEPPGFF